ncbi:MAG: diphthamide biosynthesis enzyme Dph2 [Candidatus Anstonellales archaeon]
MRILLQFPEGLKPEAKKYADELEAQGHIVILHSSPSYGACDIPIDDAKKLGADKIIHFGHTRYIKGDIGIEVEYVPITKEMDIALVDKSIPFLEGHKEFSLIATSSYLGHLEKVKNRYNELGKKANVHNADVASPGQVLGCDGSAAKDALVVFIGEGLFHLKALAGKKVLYIHPPSGNIGWAEEELERHAKRRKGALAKALEAKTFGILVSTKPGQFSIAAAEQIKAELGALGREAYIIAGNELLHSSVSNYTFIDAFITTACPRMADDAEAFGKPVLDITLCNELIDQLRNHFGK